jgi:predicted small lipoprotein YifL
MKWLTIFATTLSAIALVSLCSACGQSGPLYVPGDPSKMAVPPSTPPSDEEEKEEESDPPETD